MKRHSPFLTAKENDELQRFLASREDALCWPEVEGYVTAVASMPTPPRPNAWMAQVMGTRSPSNPPQIQRTVGHLLTLLQGIAEVLESGEARLPSRSHRPDELTAWCRGYAAAGAFDPEWNASADGAGALRAFADEGSDAVIDHGVLAAQVAANHAHWSARRQDTTEPALPATSTRVGRNEPCACGSGRKTKRCCTAA